MEDHIQVLKYLINNPELSIINYNSSVSIVAFKELFDMGYVEGIDVGGDVNPLEYLDPRITLRGRDLLAQNT
ncbi:TPA: hypothetical protein ACX6R8_000945 [Photobacterium damselae]|uniref:hypothetical protein n=1 Tax=Photobacterium damselae TaxID=38293 RepID=UPI000D05A6D1|nr:hypothetical protein [Photobacterium damselae]PSB81494.1 hypothetical protein C5F62_12615 [Photobacterium damselae subsp. damselae]